jgi:micrococcal nuclease
MSRKLLALLALAAVLAVGGGSLRGSLGDVLHGAGIGGGDGGATRAGGTAVVERVVDGDTIVLRGGERVRYIGVDTPESVKPGTPVQCFAKAASHANAALVGGRRVRLRYDVERRDRYGRTLAYVYRAGDGLFVNAALARRGFARQMTIPPNVAHAGLFRRLVAQARTHARGLWRAC